MVVWLVAMTVDQGFGHLVDETARLFARRFNERAVSFLGLTRSQCRIIRCLAGNEGVNQAGLADLLEIKPMTLVRQIDRMEEDGWVERRPDPADRRARQLQLTEKTHPVLAHIRELSGEVRREAFAGLSDEEGRTLVTLLRRVHGNLTEPKAPTVAVPPAIADAAADCRESQPQAAAAWLVEERQ
jgi:MarR family transcriptional regulator, transcriptional regulator for hemolysin